MTCGKKRKKKTAKKSAKVKSSKKRGKKKPTPEQQKIRDKIVKCNQRIEELEIQMTKVFNEKVALEARLGDG